MATGTPWSAPSASPDPRARSASLAASRASLGLPRRLACLLTEHGDVGVEPSVALLDSLQKSVHDLDRREVTAPDPCSEFCSRRKTEFFGHAFLLLSTPTASRGVLVSRASCHNSQELRTATPLSPPSHPSIVRPPSPCCGPAGSRNTRRGLTRENGPFYRYFCQRRIATTVVLYLQPAEVAGSISASPTQKKRLLAGKS